MLHFKLKHDFNCGSAENVFGNGFQRADCRKKQITR